MANMSYCRFQNTRSDLRDCINALYDGEELSSEEAKAGKIMFKYFLEYCQFAGIISSFDEEQLKDLFEERCER